MNKLLITLLIILLPSVSFAKPMWYNATSHIGGTTSSLDSVDGQNLFDGDNAIVFKASGQTDLYQLDADSALTEDSVYYRVISPDSNAGNKRWLKVGTGGRILVPDSTVDQGDSAVVGTLAWHIDNASSNDVTVTVLEGTHLVTTNTIIPATMTLKVLRGGILSLTGTLTINGTIEAGSYRIFDGTLSNLTLTPLQELNATWGAGIPDASTSQTTDLDGFLAGCPLGSVIIFPTFPNAWKFNASITVTGLTLKGMGFHKTPVIPAVNAEPVFDMEAAQVEISGFHINGNGAGTTVYGIRVDQDATSSASRFVIKNNRIQNVTNGIYIKNNYYGIVDNNKIEDVTYGMLMRNAANNNRITNTKFDDFDYGIAILNVAGTDTNKSHSNVIESCTFESSNLNGIGVQIWNTPDNKVINNYFEANTWTVYEAGGPISVVHNGAGNESFLVDEDGRDFVKLGVAVGDAVYNKTDGSTDAVVTTIVDGAATNDKLTFAGADVPSDGLENDFDDGDYCIIDLDNTTTTALRTTYGGNHFNAIAELQTFFDGVNHQASILGGWAYRNDGDKSYTKSNLSNVAANTETTIDFSGNYSPYTARPMGKVLVSVKINNDDNTAGYAVFKPIGGDNDEDQYIRINLNASSVGPLWSGQLEIPIDRNFKVAYEATTQTDLVIRLHAIWQ